ncbi:MAG: hypothetical protein FWF80_05745 [Defluviitaleaceae bacterium]|nr:hypothetical protein [Defluviitaleaceae bacterium]
MYKDIANTFDMDRKRLLFYLSKADEFLAETGEVLTIYVSGGANMCLYVGSRTSTRDIDTVPSDEVLLKKLAKHLQALFDLPRSWLNPSGTLFVTDKMIREAVLGLDFNNLKVHFLSFRAMLVLKVLAARKEPGKHDLEDAIVLIRKLGIKSVAEIDALVNEYKPDWNNPFVLAFAEEALRLSRK